MKLALVVPHIFMHQDIMPKVIFSPGELALSLADGLANQGHKITLFTPGPIDNLVSNKKIQTLTADLTLFEEELSQRGDSYVDLLKKHPLIFITLSRQVQLELVAKAYQLANQGEFDAVHVWCNEEELALVNAQFCNKPVVFNHHEPFNFLTRYRSIFPKYPHLNWISFSLAQRGSFGQLTGESVNWVGNVYHGIDLNRFALNKQPGNYLVYMGRIIQPKGVHYAIASAKKLGLKLKIAGKHYADHSKDRYWQEFIEPEIDGDQIEYVGFIKTDQAKQQLLGKALALLMPSIWQEPFGLVSLEAMACGTPVVGFNQGGVSEIIEAGQSGWLADYLPEKKIYKNGKNVDQSWDQLKLDQDFQENVSKLSDSIKEVDTIDRSDCRKYVEENFSIEKMCQGYEQIYQKLAE